MFSKKFYMNLGVGHMHELQYIRKKSFKKNHLLFLLLVKRDVQRVTVTVKLLRCINHGHFCILDFMQLILEDLPDEFAKVVESYNRKVTDIFSQYPGTVAKWLGEGRGENYKLPLSGIGKKYLIHILVRLILHFLEPEYIFREYVIPVKRFHAAVRLSVQQ